MKIAPSLEEWQTPILLDTHDAPSWPRGVFPGPFEEFISELSRATETPIELAALMMLSAVATIAQGHYIVQVKTDYFEPVNIWASVALQSGSRKSAVQGACVAPLTEWERLQKEKVSPLIQEHESLTRTTEARLRALRTKAANSNDEDFTSLAAEVATVEQQLQNAPTVPQLWTSDVTPENLGVIMAEHNERMAILSDEGGIFDTLGGRYNGGIPNLDLVLKAHSGTPCRVNRGSRPPLFLTNPCLTMGLSPQPNVLEGLARNKAFRGRGLVARFLYALPPSNLGHRTLDEPPMAPAAVTGYHSAITALLELTNQEMDHNKEKSVLEIIPAAYDRWREYALVIEIRMQNKGPYAYIRDWAGKLPGAIARIAGLLHIMKSYDGQKHGDMIDFDTMKAAISMGHCLQHHALAVFDLIGENPNKTGARKILAWLESERPTCFTRRECNYVHKSYFKTVEELQPCLELLEEKKYIRSKEKEKGPGRPSQSYDVNPYLYEDMEEE